MFVHLVFITGLMCMYVLFNVDCMRLFFDVFTSCVVVCIQREIHELPLSCVCALFVLALCSVCSRVCMDLVVLAFPLLVVYCMSVKA